MTGRRDPLTVGVAAAFVAVPAAVLLVPPLLPGLGFHYWVQLLAALIVLAALPAAILFPLTYSRASWWRTHLGRAVMMLATGLAGIIVLAALRVLADWPDIADTYSGDPVEVDLIRLAVYGWLGFACYYQLAALWLVSRRGRDLHSDDAEIRAE